MKKLKPILHLSLMVSLAFSISILSQEKKIMKDDVLKAINELALYASEVVLDDNGVSKCDYNVIEGRWYPYEEPWHTGQIINGLVDAYKVTGKTEYLEAAKKAGDWWCSLLIENHPKLKGMLNAVHGDHAGDVIVFATVSDGTPGLFNLYKTTGIKKYAEVPSSAGNWMLENMYVPEHAVFYDSVDPESGEVMKEDSPFWPNKEKQKLYDVSRPNNEGSLFKDIFEFTGDEKFKQVFIDLCESLVEKQDQYGLWMDFMPNDKESGSFHPRFNLWYAESLLEGFELTKDERYLEAAKKTLSFYTKFQKSDGTFHYKNFVDGSSNENSITGSAVAFIGILGIRIAGYGMGDEYKDNIEKSFNWILKNRYSVNHPDKNLAGALINLRKRNKKGKLWITNRDVGTAFGLRFLAAYYNYKFSGIK